MKISQNCFFLLFIFLFGSAQLGHAQNGEVRGFLYDSKSGEPILFSPVFLKGTKFGTNTDINGFFSLSKIPPGNYQIYVVNLLYDTIIESISITASRILTKKFLLKEKIRELKEVEIRGSKNKQARINTVNSSITRITPKEIRHVPPIGGEHDLAQYLQTIPGVTFTGDQGGQLYIRGGSNVQTLSLMDGMMINNPFHSLGLFSVFDTDILKNVDVYTAAFPSEYGGRTSAVIDVKTIDGNKNKLGGKISVNPFAAKAILEGPLVKGTNGGGVTFLASYRNSYLNKTSPIIYPYANQSGNYLPFSFSDAYGKMTFHGDNGNKASLFGFNFRDRANLGKQGNYNWNSYGYGGNFLLIPTSTTVLISGNLGYSKYDVGIEEELIDPRKSTITNLNGSLDFTYYLNKNELRYGLGIVNNSTKFDVVDPKAGQRLFEANNAEIFSFVKFKYNSGKRLILEPNVRFQYYASLGIIRVEPRFGAKLILTDKIRLKGAAGLYSQNLVSTQSDRDVIALFQGFLSSPEPVYKRNEETVGNPNNVPVKSALQKSVHFVAGIEYDINEDIEITIEPYIKTFSDFVNINRERKLPGQPEFIVETGVAKGIDFLIKYDKKPYYLQASYSLGKVDRTFNGLTYSPIFDRRHNINLVGAYTFGSDKSWDFSIRWNLGSGFPFTQTFAFYENLNLDKQINNNIVNNQNGNLGIYYGEESDFNKGRQPYFHRLDVAITKTWKFDDKSKIELIGSIVNTYNRENVFYFDRVQYRRINQLPFLPSIGASYAF